MSQPGQWAPHINARLALPLASAPKGSPARSQICSQPQGLLHPFIFLLAVGPTVPGPGAETPLASQPSNTCQPQYSVLPLSLPQPACPAPGVPPFRPRGEGLPSLTDTELGESFRGSPVYPPWDRAKQGREGNRIQIEEVACRRWSTKANFAD